MDAELTLIKDSALFSEPNDETETGLDQALFEQVAKFYSIDHTVLYAEGITRPPFAEAHLKVAQQIGALMDAQFLKHLKGRDDFEGIDRIVDILPLRGALGLVPEKNPLSKLNTKGNRSAYTMLPIGIKRNGPQAKIYFPSEITLGSRLSEDTEKTIYRIKDFGIATGGTSVELVDTIKRLVDQGIRSEQIVIQGAAGTFLAQERIRKEFPEINILFAVEGEMPIEREAKRQLNEPGQTKDYLTLISENETRILEESAHEKVKIDPSYYYLDRIRQVDGVPFANTQSFEGGKISASDWGDESFTAMDHPDFIQFFIERLQLILIDNGQELSPSASRELFYYYMKTLAVKA